MPAFGFVNILLFNKLLVGLTNTAVALPLLKALILIILYNDKDKYYIIIIQHYNDKVNYNKN